MENITANKKSAMIAFLMAMPLAILFFIEINNIEPLSRFLREQTTNGDGYGLNAFGKILMLGSLLLLPAAFAVNLIPITRNLRAGNSITAIPINLLLAVALFIFIASLVTGFVIDQYPCWIGVPNCD